MWQNLFFSHRWWHRPSDGTCQPDAQHRITTSWKLIPTLCLLPDSPSHSFFQNHSFQGGDTFPPSWHLWAGPTVCPWTVPGVRSTWAFHPGTSGSLWGGGGGLWSQGSLQLFLQLSCSSDSTTASEDCPVGIFSCTPTSSPPPYTHTYILQPDGPRDSGKRGSWAWNLGQMKTCLGNPFLQNQNGYDNQLFPEPGPNSSPPCHWPSLQLWRDSSCRTHLSIG